MSTPQLLHSSRRRVLLGRGLGGNENSPGERRGEFSTVICYGKIEKTGTGGEGGSRGGEGLGGDESPSVCVSSGDRTAPSGTKGGNRKTRALKDKGSAS